MLKFIDIIIAQFVPLSMILVICGIRMSRQEKGETHWPHSDLFLLIGAAVLMIGLTRQQLINVSTSSKVVNLEQQLKQMQTEQYQPAQHQTAQNAIKRGN